MTAEPHRVIQDLRSQIQIQIHLYKYTYIKQNIPSVYWWWAKRHWSWQGDTSQMKKEVNGEVVKVTRWRSCMKGLELVDVMVMVNKALTKEVAYIYVVLRKVSSKFDLNWVGKRKIENINFISVHFNSSQAGEEYNSLKPIL